VLKHPIWRALQRRDSKELTRTRRYQMLLASLLPITQYHGTSTNRNAGMRGIAWGTDGGQSRVPSARHLWRHGCWRVLTVQVRSGRPPSDGAVVVRHSSTGRASSCGHGRAGACMMHGLLPADTEFPIHCFAERTEVSVLVWLWMHLHRWVPPTPSDARFTS
jgi:hypothetical protein